MSPPLFLTCREVTDRLTFYQEGALSPLSRLRVGLHLGLCRGCQAFLASLRSLPKLVALFAPDPDLEIAKSVLAKATARLGEPRIHRIPATLGAELSAGGEPLLRLQALAHLALIEGRNPTQAPYLLPGVLEHLPPLDTWKWRSLGLGGARVAHLATSVNRKFELLIMSLPPNRRFPAHHHLGSESLLILQGGLDDGTTIAEPGHWRFYEKGHPDHAPTSSQEGCWALVRVEADGIRFKGWRGWFQRWLG